MDYKQPEENNNLDLTNKAISWDGIQNKPDRDPRNIGNVAMSSPESAPAALEDQTPELGKIVDNEPNKDSVADQVEQAIDNTIYFDQESIQADNTKDKNIGRSTLKEMYNLEAKFKQDSNCATLNGNVRRASEVYWKHAWNRNFGEGKKAA